MDTYTIELVRKTGEGDHVVRKHGAADAVDAEVMFEAIRDTFHQREGIVWEAEEVNNEGILNGESLTGVWFIRVTPSIKVTQ